jgi:hypothetical protein
MTPVKSTSTPRLRLAVQLFLAVPGTRPETELAWMTGMMRAVRSGYVDGVIIFRGHRRARIPSCVRTRRGATVSRQGR